jgi:hypothetical protein
LGQSLRQLCEQVLEADLAVRRGLEQAPGEARAGEWRARRNQVVGLANGLFDL